MKLRGLSSNPYIHVSFFCDLYIPTISLPILLQENRWTDLIGIYKSGHRNVNVEIKTEAAQFLFFDGVNKACLGNLRNLGNYCILFCVG